MAALSDPVTNILTRRANHQYIYILTAISILEHRRPGLRAGGPYAVSLRWARKQIPREQCPPVAIGPGSEAGATAENIFALCYSCRLATPAKGRLEFCNDNDITQ
jgi:hypothetical protein